MSDSRPAPWLRSIVFLLISAAVGGGGWMFWQQQKALKLAPTAAPKAKGAMPISTAKVTRMDYALDLLAIGTVAADESIDLSANVTETVTALHFEDGQQVKKGTLLVELSAAEELAALSASKSQLTEHEREITRLQSLVKDGAAPEARLEERRTLADVAKQNILEAEARLADRRIVAPFDGWLGLRRISVGALVSPGTVIVSLDKIDVVKIDFSVPETYLGMIKEGTEIEARTEATRDRVFKGKLSRLDSRVDPATRAVAARAEVPNADLLLKPGMLVTASLRVEPRISLSIPERALVPIGSKTFVFTITEDKAKRVEITIGRRKPGYIEVLKGLEENQLVVADGLVGLQDGMVVKITGQFAGPVKAFDPEALSSKSSGESIK
ncbi:MAG: efflux RND transporter periplasmic adaptor subunit [Prosthecobacter sp.]